MKKTQICAMLICTILALGALGILYYSSPINKEIRREGFDRLFLEPSVIEQKGMIDLAYNSFYLAGFTKQNIYLGNVTAPLLVTMIDTLPGQPTRERIVLRGRDSLVNPGSFRLAVDSPYFFLTNGTVPEILRGKIRDWEAQKLISGTKNYFADALPMTPASFAFRSLSAKTGEFELAKQTINTFQFRNTLLEKQIDGKFCVDGQLQYSKDFKRIIYLYYYRNEFIVADSNLALIFRANTIDTFSRAQVRVSDLKTNRTTLSAPPIQTNGKSCLWGKYLLIRSNLLSNNERIQSFLTNAVIDIYNIEDGQYFGSFYLPKYLSHEPTDFKAFGNHLAVVYDRYLVLYTINITDLELRPLKVNVDEDQDIFTGKNQDYAEHLYKPK